jgi:hypothetical protein
MILKGSQRGNAAQLARHLMNARDRCQWTPTFTS